ncbi:MAG: divergent polysaccharide deacetylase family protein, partial [Ferrovibrionaceae bacterium]
SRTSPHSVGLSLAQRDGLPAVGRDVFLDHEMAAAAVDRRLGDLEAVARRQGHAIAIGHPHDVTIAAVRRFLAEMPGKGLTLVPVSTLVRLASDG